MIYGASALRFMTYRDYTSQDPNLPHCNSGSFKGAYGYKSAKCGCRDHENKANGKLLYHKQIGGWKVPYYEVVCKGQQFDEAMDDEESVGYGHKTWGPDGQYNGRGVNSHSFSNPQAGVRGNSFSRSFDETMDDEESVGYGHNPWGPDGQYNGRGVNSHSFSNPQAGVRGNSFSRSFDETMDDEESVGYGHNPWGPDGQYNGRGVNSHSFSNPQAGVRGNSFSRSFDAGRSLRGIRCPKNLKCKFTMAFCKRYGMLYVPAKGSPADCCPSMCIQRQQREYVLYRL